MAKEARHHHYLPQCYLRGFAVGRGKQCRLTVANIAGKNYFETNPRNVGGVRDFNRVQIAGFKPDAIEGMLANFEGQVATALRNVAVSTCATSLNERRCSSISTISNNWSRNHGSMYVRRKISAGVMPALMA